MRPPAPTGRSARRRFDCSSDCARGMRRCAQRGAGGPTYDFWFERGVNNAAIALLSTYDRWVPALEALLARSGGDLRAFYRAGRCARGAVPARAPCQAGGAVVPSAAACLSRVLRPCRSHCRKDLAMEEANAIHARHQGHARASRCPEGVSLTSRRRREKLEEVDRELELPDVWSQPERAQALGREAREPRPDRRGLRAPRRRPRGRADAPLHGRGGVRRRDRRRGRRRTWRRSRSTSAPSSSAECSLARWTPPTRFSTSRPVPAGPRRRTGPRCCSACTCGGASGAGSQPS